jgi:hypothetical protein
LPCAERTLWEKTRDGPYVSEGSQLGQEDLDLLEMSKEEAAHAPAVEVFIREASKALSPLGACEKSGRPVQFASFVEKAGVEIRSAGLRNFRGSRFNILFVNGAGWYALLEQVTAFLDELKKVDGGLNRLLQAVLEKSRDPNIQASLKVRELLTSSSAGFAH